MLSIRFLVGELRTKIGHKGRKILREIERGSTPRMATTVDEAKPG